MAQKGVMRLRPPFQMETVAILTAIVAHDRRSRGGACKEIIQFFVSVSLQCKCDKKAIQYSRNDVIRGTFFYPTFDFPTRQGIVLSFGERKESFFVAVISICHDQKILFRQHVLYCLLQVVFHGQRNIF